MKIIYNGTIIEASKDHISEDGWLLGSGIFETIKTTHGAAWALTRHMRRAVSSARRVNLKLPGEEIVRAAIVELLTLLPYESGVLRASFDHNGNWACVHNPYQENRAPAHLVTFPTKLATDGVPIKSYPYKHRLNILHEVTDKGFDEAIVINTKEKVCEGAVTNLLLQINNQWCTPALSDGVLPGVMRALVIENFGVKVRSIDVAEISDIQTAFLLSSLRIAQPVATIDHRELAQSQDFEDEIRAMAIRTSVG